MTRDQQILAVATRLFYERGFHAVSIDEIGAAVGITGPAIYRHFSSKDEILATIFDQAFDRLVSRIGGEFDDPREELERLVRVHVERSLSEPEVAGVHSREGHSLAEPFRRRIERREREYVQRWVDCLQRCFPSRSADSLVSVTWAIIAQLSSIAFWPAEARRATDLVELLSTLVLGGLNALEDDAVSARRTAATAELTG